MCKKKKKLLKFILYPFLVGYLLLVMSGRITKSNTIRLYYIIYFNLYGEKKNYL